MSNGTMTETVPLSNLEQIVGRITELQEKLQAATPGYERLLQEIHVALFKQEELAHLLSPEQIGVIVAGLSKKKNVVLAIEATKGAGRRPKVKTSLEDLM